MTSPAADADGDQVSYRYEWRLNGKVVPGATSARFPSPLRKRDVAGVQVTPWDGELAGPSSAAECSARNTPPTAPRVVLEPAEPTALTGLSVKVVQGALDHDRDPVAYRYRWSRDGLPSQLDGPMAPPRTVRHGEIWRVEVIPSDGDEDGPPVEVSAVVGNTRPPTPAAVVKPLSPPWVSS